MLEWRTLFSEDLKTLSLGRIAFWIALAYSTWFWFHPLGHPFPNALLEFLYATLGYNLGSKGIGAYQRVKSGSFLPTLTPQQGQYTPPPQVKIQEQNDLTEEDLNMTKGK